MTPTEYEIKDKALQALIDGEQKKLDYFNRIVVTVEDRLSSLYEDQQKHWAKEQDDV